MVIFVMVLKGSAWFQENRALKTVRFTAKSIYTRLRNGICFNQDCVGWKACVPHMRWHVFLWRAWEGYEIEHICLYLSSADDNESDGEEDMETDLNKDDVESKEEVSM